MPQPAFVALVGASLGGATYLTQQAREYLSRAQVLIYDALVDRQVLALVPADCLLIPVGKRGGRPSTSQAEIDRLVVEYASAQKRVVRLKNGDPFIFGRAREEIRALQAAGHRVEIVPGLSSAIAAPLLAGIPLTDKHYSTSFAVSSAHDPDRLNWAALAGIDTLVFLMGGRQLGAIVERLQAQGRSPQTPIAIIRSGGTPQQQVWQGTLAEIVALASGQALSPCAIVVGDVVQLRASFACAIASLPVNSLPLNGKTVLVTRSASQASAFRDLLQHQGATVIDFPAIEIGPPSSWGALDLALDELDRFDWLLLTSVNGVDAVCDRLQQGGRDARSLAGLKIAAVGKKTAEALARRGLRADFIPSDYVADSLAAEFPEPLGDRAVLFPRVETGGRDALVKEFEAKGAEVSEVAAYESRIPEQIPPLARTALVEKAIDAVTFASSKTVRNFCQLVQEAIAPETDLSPYLDGVAIAAIGPQTAQTCRQLLGRVDIEASEYTLDGLSEAIAAYFAN